MSYEPENGAAENVVESEIVKCPGCGSNMVFDPKTQSLYCAHCDNTVNFDTDKNVEEIDINKGFETMPQWDTENSVYSCDNCGAKVVLGKGETANSCPFCGTAHVTKSEELAGLKPNALIPFTVTVETAVKNVIAWAKKKLFAPRQFKKTVSPDNVKGVYSPCFTFDSDTLSTYVGRIGKRHTRVVGSGKNRRTETYIVWKNISGGHGFFFDDVTVTAGTKISQKNLDKLSPFKKEENRVYEEKYLLGFMAYHYEKDITQCWSDAKKIIDAEIKKQILSRYNYDVVDYLKVSTTHSKVTYKYMMLPVYVGNNSYAKKLYNFYVNGSTGKVAGKTPVSFWRVAAAVLLGLAVVAGIAALYLLYGDGSSLAAPITEVL